MGFSKNLVSSIGTCLKAAKYFFLGNILVQLCILTKFLNTFTSKYSLVWFPKITKTHGGLNWLPITFYFWFKVLKNKYKKIKLTKDVQLFTSCFWLCFRTKGIVLTMVKEITYLGEMCIKSRKNLRKLTKNSHNGYQLNSPIWAFHNRTNVSTKDLSMNCYLFYVRTQSKLSTCSKTNNPWLSGL